MQINIKAILFLTALCSNSYIMPYTIMIDPAGDSQHIGRVIDNTFERGITLQCAESLKTALAKELPQIRVVISRIPGESVEKLQNAAFANRLQVDLYLNLQFYQETNNPAKIAFYYYSYQPLTDAWHTPKPLSFYNLQEIYLLNYNLTKKLCLDFLHIWEQEYKKYFVPLGAFGIPFQPFIGIQAPAIAIEAGLIHKDSWQMLINPLVQIIAKAIHEQ